MTQTPIKVGIVGAGFVGQLIHIPNYAINKDCSIVALAAGRPELRAKVAQRFGIPRTYATHKELLKDPEVEAVIVVTARPGIGPVAYDCLKAGKHVLTEKPMASSLLHAEKLVGAQAKNKTYAVGYQKRYNVGVHKFKAVLDQLIKSGELGPILHVRFHCIAGNNYGKADGHIVTDEKKTTSWETWSLAPDWVPDAEKQDYHQYLNFYCHDLNLMRYFFGKTPTVTSIQFDQPGFKLATFNFGSFSVLFETSTYPGRAWDESVEVYFAKGRLRIELPPTLTGNNPPAVELWRGENLETTRWQSDPSWDFRRQAETFINDAAHAKESVSSGADSLEDIRLMEAIWKMKLKI